MMMARRPISERLSQPKVPFGCCGLVGVSLNEEIAGNEVRNIFYFTVCRDSIQFVDEFMM